MNKYQMMLAAAKAKIDEANTLLGEFEDAAMPEEKSKQFDALMTEAGDLQKQAERMREVEERDAQLKSMQQSTGPAGDVDNNKTAPSFKHVYAMRFGEDTEAKSAVLTDLFGSDYRQLMWGQMAAFVKYLRFGDRGLDRDEDQLLRKQVFPWEQIELLMKAGLSVTQIKTTMVEAQGSLGGYAVPAQTQAQIASRLPGMTAVRASGAQVITLTNGNSVDVPVYTGGTDQYRGALRGAWGSETTTPGEKNATLGMTPLVAQVYTYKVSMSQSLVEDAANLVDLVTSDITAVAAVDEDTAFLTGDGANKPMGMLPSSANANGLTEVNSGAAAALTPDGIKALKRGVASQYRQRAVWVANSDTYGAIEKLKNGNGDYMFEDLSETGQLLNRRTFESDGMPDVAVNAFPLIFGDMSGYWIAERAGITIVRFQDSNTGINKVEYHVRRRIGGRLVETWKFAVQKVAA